MKIPKTFIPDKGLEEKTEDLLALKRKKDFKYASKYNNLKVDDENVQYFYDLWCEESFTSTDAQKIWVSEAYCVHVLGVSKKIFEDFEKGVYIKSDSPKYKFAEKEIGLRQGGAVERKGDFESFWEAMKTLFPLDYTQEDINFLMEGKELSVFQLVYQFAYFCTHPLLHALKTNAHVYK